MYKLFTGIQINDNKKITNRIINNVEMVSLLSISYKIPPIPMNDMKQNNMYLCLLLQIMLLTLCEFE